MAKSKFPFVGAAYEARSISWNMQKCVNFYVDVDLSTTAKDPTALIGCPGKRLALALPGSGGVRGMLVPSTGGAIVVRGSTVYRLSTDYSYVTCGTLNTSAGTVRMADNGQLAMIVDGPCGYSLDMGTNVLTQITDPDFPGATTVDYVDGYFLFNIPGTQKFAITGLFDVAVDGSEFASAEGAPDLLVALRANFREVWLFGKMSAEIFADTGNTDFPFERIQGAFIPVGCEAPHSIGQILGATLWLGCDKNGGGQVFSATSYTPVNITTPALAKALQSYPDRSDAIGYCYQQDNHSFYVLTFPGSDRTWCYDLTNGLWHERASHDSSGVQRRDRGNCHMYFGNKHLVGDFENGNIYELDLDCYVDHDRPLRSIRECPYIESKGAWTYFDYLTLDCDTGVGLISGQGSSPQLMMQFSDDGGNTWSSIKRKTLGAIGEYFRRVRFRLGGRSRSRVFRVTITDPVKRCITSGVIDADVGDA
jgi:hypothetical protein